MNLCLSLAYVCISAAVSFVFPLADPAGGWGGHSGWRGGWRGGDVWTAMERWLLERRLWLEQWRWTGSPLSTDSLPTVHRQSTDSPPCVLPGSKLYWVLVRRFLTVREHAALQGIWAIDFPELDVWLRTQKHSNVVKDMCGNAFSSTVSMAVCFAVIATT